MNTKKEQARLNQTEILNSLTTELKANEMLTVYFSHRNKDYIHHSHNIYCALIPHNYKNIALNNLGWDLFSED